MLLEWLGERINPGHVGHLNIHENDRTRSRFSIIVMGVVAVFVAALPLYFFYCYGSSERGLWAEEFFIFSIEILYLGVAYVLKPEPDTRNMGLVGWIIPSESRMITIDFCCSFLRFSCRDD